MTKKLRLILLSLFIFVFPLLLPKGTVYVAQTEREKELQTQIEQYQKEIDRLKVQQNTLNNQIAQFDAQIKLTELRIDQTEEKMNLLGGRIDSLEVSLQSLTEAFTGRAVETYKMARVGNDPVSLVATSSDLTLAVSRFNYLQRIQSADRELLIRLQKAQNSYKEQKTDLEGLQAELEGQRKNLASQKTSKNNLLQVTKNDEKKYQQLLSDAKAQLAAFRRFVTSQGGATILTGQTKCDGWGCYYNQRDSGWGNLAIGNSSSSMAEYGCLITSMAMVASHYGKSLKPGDIATTASVFFGDTAFMNQGTWSAGGVSMTRTRVCSGCGEANVRQRMDEELNAGRPVVVGVYSGPDHFIVIKAKSGDGYIMNDPFLENGGDRPFSDKYILGNIKTIDVVRVN